MLYNADEKAISRSEIETRFVLYREGVEFRRGESMPVTLGEVTPNGVPIVQTLTIAPNMPPGDYILQLMATDKKNDKKQESKATQAVSFTVVEK